MIDLYAPALPAEPKKQCLPRRCSTCANRKCRTRGIVMDWMNCADWKEPPEKRRKPC